MKYKQENKRKEGKGVGEREKERGGKREGEGEGEGGREREREEGRGGGKGRGRGRKGEGRRARGRGRERKTPQIPPSLCLSLYQEVGEERGRHQKSRTTDSPSSTFSHSITTRLLPGNGNLQTEEVITIQCMFVSSSERL